jgi:TATA-box binding protein (TBP) (component of TFIID and TFIIIB)
MSLTKTSLPNNSNSSNINWNNHNFIDYFDIKKNDISNLPPGVKISTISCSCKDGLGTDINLTNILKYMELNKNDILQIKKDNNNMRTLIPKKKSKRRSKKVVNKKAKTSYFFHQITMIVRVFEGDISTDDLRDNEPKINFKIFKNGSIQMTGVKSIEYANRAINKIIYKLSQVKGKKVDNKITKISFVEDRKKLTVRNFKMDMINTNYKVNMQIDRKSLYDLLLKMRVKVTFEKCIRACVIIKYYPKDPLPSGKPVSIFVFQAGNIIITGAKNRNHVIDSYKYINDIFVTHSDYIIKKDQDEEGKKLLQYYDEILKENSHKLDELGITNESLEIN